MNRWTVELIPQAVKEISKFSDDLQAGLSRLSSVIEETGLQGMRAPHVKHLAGKIWEMRVTGKDNIARALYVTAVGRRVIVLHAFIKKTQHTPPAALLLAIKRAKEEGLI